MAIFLGFLGHFVTLALGFESAGAFKLILICVISALTSGVILQFSVCYLFISGQHVYHYKFYNLSILPDIDFLTLCRLVAGRSHKTKICVPYCAKSL
ncbi:Mg/Co/Ni transporter MgtE [Methanosarcina sp. WWM596]|nr:Mg/Co/Ni transporter MgtE [Methanosarcina sp. WWM596]AKB21288.1 Mg/Co/Ni transporter MgtE [Methanosarcina sp. WH1]